MLTQLVSPLFALPFYVLCGLGIGLIRSFGRGRRPSWRWRGLLIACAVGTYLLGAPVFPDALIHHIEHRYEPRSLSESDRNPDNLIVVLTAGWFREGPAGPEARLGEDGWERLDAGVKLWQRVGGTLLITGAPAPHGSSQSVAGAMADIARAFGVPASAIVVEPLARNTHENLTFPIATLREHRDHLWLVTSALHLPRAMAVAHKLGLNPVPYPCFYRGNDHASWQDWLPSNVGPSLFGDAMHEEVGSFVYRVRGWAE